MNAVVSLCSGWECLQEFERARQERQFYLIKADTACKLKFACHCAGSPNRCLRSVRSTDRVLARQMKRGVKAEK